MNPFAGKWCIAEMEVWDQEYVDMEVSGFVRISPNGTGRFQFGLVSGDIDGRVNNAAKLHVLSSPGSDRMKTIRFAAGVGPLSKMTSCKATSICIWLTIRLFGPSRVNSVTHEPIKQEKTGLGRPPLPGLIQDLYAASTNRVTIHKPRVATLR